MRILQKRDSPKKKKESSRENLQGQVLTLKKNNPTKIIPKLYQKN